MEEDLLTDMLSKHLIDIVPDWIERAALQHNSHLTLDLAHSHKYHIDYFLWILSQADKAVWN